MIRKFYDAAVAEAGGGADTKFHIGESFSFQDAPAVEETAEETEVDETEERKEVVVEEKETVKEEKVEEKKIEEKPVVQVPDWKELIKKPEHQKEVYSLIGIDEQALALANKLKADEFATKFFTYRDKNGNVAPFIEAATKDWDKVNHEQLILDDLKKQYSALSPEKAERLAKADFNSRFNYKDDPNLTEEENKEMADLMELKLESEAEKIRGARKTEQQQFLDSVKPVDTKAETERLAREKQEADLREFNAFKSMVEAHPDTMKLVADKKLILGGNGTAYNYTVNPDVIKEQTLDSNKFYGKFWKQEEGKDPVFNVQLWNKVVAYSENPSAFEEALIEHGRSLGVKKVVEEELENATEKTSSKAEVKKESLAKAVEKAQPFTFE